MESVHQRPVLFHVATALYAAVCGGVLLVFAANTARGGVALAIATAALCVITIIASRRIARHLFFAITPLLFLLGMASLMFFVDSMVQRNIMAGIASVIVYAVLLGSYRLRSNVRDAVARGMIVAGIFSGLFLWYAGTFAVYVNFTVPRTAVLVILGFWTLLVSWQYFVMVARGRFSQTVMYAVAVTVVMVQVIAVALWWPFGHMTSAIVLLMIYYIVWDMCDMFFRDTLSRSRVVVNTILLILVALMVLMSAQWRPVV